MLSSINTTLAPLQRVMHAAARVIYDLKPYDHVTPTLKDLHWLPVKQRIGFKLCLLVHLLINKRAPVYLQNLLKLLYLCLVGPQTARAATTTLSSSQPDSNLVNAPSPLLDRSSGISCLLASKPSGTQVFSGTNLNLF